MRIKARQRRRWSVINLVVWLGVVCALIFPAYQWTKSNITELAEWRNSRLSPVIMIPGSSATPNRFDTMVKKINAHAPQKHSLLKIKVWNSGKITYSGKIRPKDNEPFIVVGFQNNHDGYGNIKKQAAMFNRVFGILCSRYHFNNFKAIGHSNGGLIYTLFFEKYFHQYSDREHVDQIMTIGTPYNFSEDSITHKTQMLADFIKTGRTCPMTRTCTRLRERKTTTVTGWCQTEALRPESIFTREWSGITRKLPLPGVTRSTPISRRTRRLLA